MKIQLCAKCKKRPASVFITRLDNGTSTNEGLCFRCAAELGIKPPPVVDMLKKMGIDEDAIQNMSEEIGGLVSGEHGIGYAKKEYLKRATDPSQILLMQKIKAAFDPKNILNPGKII